MPDGTLLSLPIPSNDEARYDDLCYNNVTYADILRDLRPRGTYAHCHIDPDIRENNRVSKIPGWKAAFGQTGPAQGMLHNANIEEGDIFLFFGWFRRVELYEGGYRFVDRRKGDFYAHSDLQIIYGYMQIGEIITDKDRISEYRWHPHSSVRYAEDDANTIYSPTEDLSILPYMKGSGTLDYRRDRVLTMEGKKRGTWNELPFLMPEHVYGKRKNSAKGNGLYYSGIWQELVVYESDGLLEWVKSIIA